MRQLNQIELLSEERRREIPGPLGLRAAGRVIAACALLMTGSISAGLVSQPAQAQDAPFTCDDTMYLSQGNPTRLYSFDTNSNPFAVNPVGSTHSSAYNATGFNPNDGYLYALGSGNLLQIDSTGDVTNLGTVPGLPGAVAGTFGPDGTYYTLPSNSNMLYLTDVDAMTTSGQMLTLSMNVQDLAWYDGQIYTATGGSAGRLYAIDPGTGNVTDVGPTNAPLTSGFFGALFSDANGIYGGNNAGGFYRFDLNTGQATQISDLPGSGTNDGAKCLSTALEFPVDLSVDKSDGSTTFEPGTINTYTITVANAGPFGAAGAVVSDPLPAGISTANWTCGAPATGGATCAAPSGSQANGNAIDDAVVNLPINSSLTFVVELDVPGTFAGTLENTATVTAPAGSPDNDLSNNTDSDTSISLPLLTLAKVVENDDNGTLGAADFTLTATGPDSILGVHGSPDVTNRVVRPGAYTLGEVTEPGYSASLYSCTMNGGAATSGNSLNLQLGDAAVCTITNSDEPATLTLVKEVVNNHGGDADAGDFTLIAAGPTTITGQSGQPEVTAVAVDAGDYTLSEDGPAGYSAGNFRCVVNGGSPIAAPSPLSLDVGDDAVCTITNDDMPPDISIRKELVDESYDPPNQEPDAGEELTYTITLTNAGGPDTNFDLIDELDANVTVIDADGGAVGGGQIAWSGLSVPAHDSGVDGTLVLTVIVQVDAGLAAGTPVANIVRRPGESTPPCPSDQCVVIPPSPVVSIEKTLVDEPGGTQDGVAEPGETLTYQIRLTNPGSTTTDFDLEDELGPYLDFDSAVPPPDTVSGQTLSWDDLTVLGDFNEGAGNGFLDIFVDVTVLPLDPGVTSVSNFAKESGDPDPDCPSSQCVVTPTTGEVSIAKALVGQSGSNDDAAEPGETLSYEITLTNTGGSAAAMRVVDDYDETVVTYQTSSEVTSIDDGDILAWDVSVPPYSGSGPGVLTVTANYLVDNDLSGATTVTNLAYEDGDTPPSCPSGQCVQVPTAPEVSLSKAVQSESGAIAGTAEAGEEITYAITLTNDGGADATGFVLEDVLDDNLSFVDASDGGTLVGGVVRWTLTVPGHNGTTAGTEQVTVTFRVDDPLPRGVTSIGNFVREEDGPDPVCPADDACAELPTEPLIVLSKQLSDESLTDDGIGQAGERLTYEITVANHGGSDAVDYAFEDRFDDALLEVVDADGGSHTSGSGVIAWTQTVPAHDGTDAGEITVSPQFDLPDPLPDGFSGATNVVAQPGDDPLCPSDQCVTVPLDGIVSISKALVSESGDTDGLAEPGEELTYEITLTNFGGPVANYDVQDILDPNVSFVSADNSGVDNGTTVDWTVSVPGYAGSSAGEVVLTVVVEVVDPLPAGVVAIANVANQPGGSDPCPSVQCVSVPTPGQISITKALVAESGQQDDMAEPGETLTYEIALTNTGGAVSDYEVQDVLDPNTTFVSADNGGSDGGTTIDWSGLNVPAHDGVNPGTLVLTATVRVNDPLPEGVVELTNIAKEPGTPDPACPSDQCATITAQDAGLELVKTSAFDDSDGNGVSNVGDAIVFTFDVTNTGNITLDDVSPIDPGPQFNGVAGANALSVFDPQSVTLDPGENQRFTASYTLSQSDVDAAAGISDGVENEATARGYANGNSVTGTPVDSQESITVLALPAAATNVSIAKVALLRTIRRGEQAPFAITITNHGGSQVTDLIVIDTVPSGFRYVEGTARIDGVEVVPKVEGRRVIFEDIDVAGNSEIEIRLRLLALSSAGPGEHVNWAGVADLSGNALAPDVSATVEILAEAVFDCGDVIGKVFDDHNQNGYQDEGERGLPGVRLATVEGWLITTDADGQFHVACAMLPDQRIGSNFILKLDPRTLPTGYRVTTENPRVVRLTAGKMTELNFGAALGRVIRLDLEPGAFVSGDTALTPQWDAGLDQLIAVLMEGQSSLELTYTAQDGDAELAQERLLQTNAIIKGRWRAQGDPYQLEIEMRLEVGQ